MFKLNIKADQAFEWRNGLLMGQSYSHLPRRRIQSLLPIGQEEITFPTSPAS